MARRAQGIRAAQDDLQPLHPLEPPGHFNRIFAELAERRQSRSTGRIEELGFEAWMSESSDSRRFVRRLSAVDIGHEGVPRHGACPSGGADALQENEAAYVVDEVGHADLHLGTLNANRADEEAHAGLLIGEHMLDA